jgi:C4-dicarboxylate transporter DctM subunit
VSGNGAAATSAPESEPVPAPAPPPDSAPRSTIGKLLAAGHTFEEYALLATFTVAMVLPILEAFGRPFGGSHIPDSQAYQRQSVLWLTFLGGLVAAREHGHIGMSTAELMGHGRLRYVAQLVGFSIAAAVAGVLAYASVLVVIADQDTPNRLLIVVPVWIFECVMPLALTIMAFRFAWQAGESMRERAAAFGLMVLAFLLPYSVPDFVHTMTIPLVALVLGSALLGAPVFLAMTGAALVLFFSESTPISAVPAEIYRLLGSPTLPAIPLLTATGYILAESKASVRLVRFLRALFGWMPGGIAIVVVALCALFTAFTGGSGVTILALGGLLFGILQADEYPESFSLGLVTAAGSLGLLFPPSIPVILYGVVANVPADLLYLAGALPGTLLIVLVALYGVWKGRGGKRDRADFSWKEIAQSANEAKWELSVPLVVLVLFLGGFTSLVEAAAIACAYTIIVETAITRDLHPTRDLPKVLLKAGVLVGAVLILLSAAMGFTSYLVDAQVPDRLVASVTSHIHSKVVFLLLLNVFLLVLGSVFEIYAAIVVLAPIVAPLGVAFGIDPVHLGVIFLANLELGFICPPAGLNLFLSASRFKKPLPSLYRDVLPFLAIMTVGVLLITYVEPLSIGVLHLFGKSSGGIAPP